MAVSLTKEEFLERFAERNELFRMAMAYDFKSSGSILFISFSISVKLRS